MPVSSEERVELLRVISECFTDPSSTFTISISQEYNPAPVSTLTVSGMGEAVLPQMQQQNEAATGPCEVPKSPSEWLNDSDLFTVYKASGYEDWEVGYRL